MADELMLFNDLFEVTKVNPDGKKFDRVNRLLCTSSQLDIQLLIDVASELFPLAEGEKVALAVASKLDLSGTDSSAYDFGDKPSLLDSYDYGMSGKVFRYSLQEDGKLRVVVSHGGLLMMLEGPRDQLKALEMDSMVFTLLRKQ